MSDPERAVLELLSEVGVRQSLQDVRDVLEGTTSLRAAVLQDLLSRCRQVKTVRLCLTLGRELGLPWAAKLDPAGLPTGSRGRWVGRSKEGLLVLEPMNAAYLATVRLLAEVAPVIFESGILLSRAPEINLSRDGSARAASCRGLHEEAGRVTLF